MRVGEHEVLSLNTPTHWDSYNPFWLWPTSSYMMTCFSEAVSVSLRTELWSVYSFMHLSTRCTCAQKSDVGQGSRYRYPSAPRSKNHLVKSETQQIPTSEALRSIPAVLVWRKSNQPALLLMTAFFYKKVYTVFLVEEKSNLRWTNDGKNTL